MPIEPVQPRSSSAVRLALAAAACHGVALLAQNPEVPAPFAERVEVEVVNVDVVVTDRDGRRVTDLARGDFELRVDGRPVAIEYFAAPPLSSRPAAPAPAPSAVAELAPAAVAPLPPPAEAPAPGILVVYVDQSALERRVRRETIAELREFVAARDANERVMIAAFENHLRLFAAPTGDEAALEAAFAALQELPSHGSMIRAERNRLEHEVRAVGRVSPMVRSSNAASNAQAVQRRQESETGRLQHEIELWAEEELDRQRRSVRAMSQVVAALAALPGRKTAVLATAGFNSEPARFLLRFLAQKIEVDAAASSMSRVARLDELGLRLSTDYEELVRAAQNARVAFYTVAARDEPPAQNSAEFASAGRDQAKPPPHDFSTVEQASSMTRLAAATGGRLFVLDAGLDERLEAVRDDVRAVYSLGFTTGPEAGARDHEIEVRTRRDGLEVRHRESFRRRTTEERQEEALLAAATLGEVANGAGLVLELGAPVPADRGKKGMVVPIAVRIPLASVALLPDGQLRHGRLTVRVAVHDADGKVLEGKDTPVSISVRESEAERALAGVWVHRAEMRLTPGRHRVAVLVADAGGGGFSTVSGQVEVAGR
jgi:VWFA-related protein